jgi:hypothetical protein
MDWKLAEVNPAGSLRTEMVPFLQLTFQPLGLERVKPAQASR